MRGTGLGSDDALPLRAEATLDLGQSKSGITRRGVRGTFLADLGLIDVPCAGEVRARVGLRCSDLYPKGALELSARKALRSDASSGYEMHAGAQTAGDDSRLDLVADIHALKHFKNARAFYRFTVGMGCPFEDGPSSDLSWCRAGSSLGVTQVCAPPCGRGELTVGWRSGLFDDGFESAVVQAAKRAKGSKKGRKDNLGLLRSSPFTAYSVGPPGRRVSSTVLPAHDLLQHAAEAEFPLGSASSRATLTATLDQSLSDPARLKLRLGATYVQA